jgi:hypothetical protein
VDSGTTTRPLTIQEIATILTIDTKQVRRYLQELKITATDRIIATQHAESLSAVGTLTRENETLKGTIRSLTTKIQRLKKLNDDTRAERDRALDTVTRFRTECTSKDTEIRSLARDLELLRRSSALIGDSESIRLAPEFPGCPLFWPNLRKHFLAWNNLFLASSAYWDQNRLKRIEYPPALHSLYALIRLQNKRCAGFLHELFGFPGHTTLDRFINERATALNITANIFDGSTSSLAIIRGVLGSVESPPRVCIGFDATAVKPYLRLELGGILHGLREADRIISTTEAGTYFRDLNPIQALLEKYAEQLATSEFVVMALALSPGCPSVPIAIFPSNSGALNSEKFARIEEIASEMESVGFDCRGFAHDGDRFLLSSAFKFLDKALIQMQCHLDNPFDFAAFMDNSVRGDFFDMLHMLKNDRMQKIHSARLLFPCLRRFMLGPEDYRHLSSIPSGAFNESVSVKMDDHLAERFFSPQALAESASWPRLFVAMFPCCALYQAMKNPMISRSDRFDLLLLVFGYMLYYAGSNAKNSDTRYRIWRQYHSQCRKIKQQEVLFRNEFIAKMVVTCFSIMRELVKGESLDLGSLGSHKNEHFFGCVKSKLRNFETDEAFVQCSRKILIARLLGDELGISFRISKRMSDSGVKLDADSCPVDGIDLGASLATARFFFRTALGSAAIPDLAPGRAPIFSLIQEFLDRYGFSAASSTRPPSVSTVSECVSSFRNASQFRNLSEASQIARSLKRSQGEDG